MAKAREIEGLDCNADAFFNINLILRTRLDEMCELRAKALDWSDIEGVHDMRVASRRLRSLLRDFAPFLNEGKAPRKQLKEIARSLGSVRDEDVAIVALKKLRRRAKKGAAAGIKQFIEERRRRQAAAREHLQAAISDEGISELQQKFTSWLLEAAASRANNLKESTDTGLTFREMGREVILSHHRELDDLSSSLFNPFDVEPLHEMRIAAKRLRYSLELFSPCLGEELREFAKEIAELQTSLGELHDCDVWIDDLGARLNAQNESAVALDAGSALSQQVTEHASDLWLLQHFVKERTKHYSNALSRWSDWKATGFYSRLKESIQETRTHQPAGS
ncbi:MAG: CHAD domain-containing protein [Pyrinomonadaceae bacterium]|nr:CHAD domain-containing protein [Pyrinomonadaceae bacterium]